MERPLARLCPHPIYRRANYLRARHAHVRHAILHVADAVPVVESHVILPLGADVDHRVDLVVAQKGVVARVGGRAPQPKLRPNWVKPALPQQALVDKPDQRIKFVEKFVE
jgi:hypothetical protein